MLRIVFWCVALAISIAVATYINTVILEGFMIEIEKIPKDEGELHIDYFVAEVNNNQITYVAEKGGWQTRHETTKRMLETLYSHSRFKHMCPASKTLLFVTNDNSSYMSMLPDGMKALTYTTKPSRPDCVAIPDFTFYHFPEAGWPMFYDFYDKMAHDGTAVEFEDRYDRLFWIGTFCHPTRSGIIDAHKSHPEFDLREFSWEHKDNDYVSIEDHARYKYLLDVRGNAAWSVRLKYLLLLGSVVFVVERDESEYWWDTFRPWEHYVPVAADGNDLVARYEYVRENPDVAQRIATDGKKRALEEFAFDTVYTKFAHILSTV